MDDRNFNPAAAEANLEAVARENVEREHRARIEQAPRQRSMTDRLSARAAALHKVAKKAKHEDYIVLPEMTAALQMNPVEGFEDDVVRVRVRRVEPQELITTGMLPQNASRLVSAWAKIGMDATESERQRRGMTDTNAELDMPSDITALYFTQIAQQVFGGDDVAVMSAFYGMVDAVCMCSLVDPDIRLYWTDDARDRAGDDYGFVISQFPEADRVTIAMWALGQEVVAGDAATAFHPGAVGRDDALSASDKVQPTPLRAGGV